MASLNKVMLIGRLGRDPETRATNGGGVVTSFSLATDETWRDKATGERRQRTEWHNIAIFNESLSKIAEQFLHKGSQVYVVGMQCTREYTDREGVERKVTEVVLKQFRGELVLLDSQKREPPSEESYGSVTTRPQQHDDPRITMGDAPREERLPGRNKVSDPLDDDIPF